MADAVKGSARGSDAAAPGPVLQMQAPRDRASLEPWDAGEPAAAAAAAGADVLADEAPAFDMRFDSAAAFFDVSSTIFSLYLAG